VCAKESEVKGSIRFSLGLVIIMVAVGDNAMSLTTLLGVAALGLILLFYGANALKANGEKTGIS
jgi:hypothetical protein